MSSIASTIKALEAAQKLRGRYPDLMLGYAVGLAALAGGLPEKYAKLLEGYDSIRRYQGGEISEREYSAIEDCYRCMHANLVRLVGRGLDPDDSQTLQKTIAVLRQLPPE